MRSNLRPGVQANPPPASLQRDCAALNKTGAKAFGRSAAHLFMYAANSVLGLEAGVTIADPMEGLGRKINATRRSPSAASSRQRTFRWTTCASCSLARSSRQRLRPSSPACSRSSPTSRSGWSRRAWDVLRNDIALNLREGSLEKLVVIHEGSRRTILGTFDSGPFGRTDL